MNFTLSFNNKKQKADIALSCILLVLTMIIAQMIFLETSIVYAEGDIVSILVKWAKRIVAELIFQFVKDWTYQGIKWAISAITPDIAMKIAALVIVGGIVASYIVGIVTIVDNVVTSYKIQNETNGCILSPSGTRWMCPESIPEEIEYEI